MAVQPGLAAVSVACTLSRARSSQHLPLFPPVDPKKILQVKTFATAAAFGSI